MKKLRLRKWVKIILTLFVVIINIGIYLKTGMLGELAQTSKFYEVLCISTWIWLLLGQMLIYGFIWKPTKNKRGD